MKFLTEEEYLSSYTNTENGQYSKRKKNRRKTPVDPGAAQEEG